MKKFLKDFLKSHHIDKSGLEIVYLNLDRKGNGMIDKYDMTVFFLNLASYECLVDRRNIKKYTGFSPIE